MIREHLSRNGLNIRGLNIRGLNIRHLNRRVGVIAASVVGLVMATSLAGCGATHTLLGIHEAPQAKPTSAPLTVEQAKKILTRNFTAAYVGETTADAAASGAALRTAYTDEGLRAVGGRMKLASVQGAVAASPLQVQHPKLLALSRGFGFPRFILAQTVASQGPPTLHLLVSPDVATPYRITTSIEMVPPATIKPFDPPSKGSPVVTNGATGGKGLAVAPAALLDQYAADLVFPAKPIPKPPFAADSFSGQVKAGAAVAAKAVSAQALFAQVHKVVPGSVHAVRQASGDALVFGVIERKDYFGVRAGQSVNTAGNKAFVLLTGKKLVTNGATINTLEFVVFAVPRSTGQATLVGAREQIVDGSGS
ncbi:MAG: hypothetical protein QOE58_2350 [Actinomycetota bacterium]|nr:hypothetical protein [Actinomycetota bacterium]